jgi:integrase
MTIRFLASDGRSQYAIYDAQRRDQALIRPKLGDVKLSALTADRLRRWRDELASTPPRLRTRKGEKQKHREPVGTDDAQRARRASTNRTWTVLRAALNHAFRDGNAESDLAWRKVTPFRKVDGARIRYLTLAEAKRLIYACDAEFRPLVQAALQTGARYGELGKLTVADFNPDVGTVTIRQSKSGKARHIVLTDEGRTFFRQLTTGRAGSEMMFEKQWGMSHQLRPMAEAVQRAKIKPSISFHGLRHTWASHAVMNGVPLMIVAKNLGHSDSRMVEKHYGHLEPSFIADAIRAGAPRFGTVASGPIVPLHSRRK